MQLLGLSALLRNVYTVHNARQRPARNNRKPAKCGQDSIRIDPDALNAGL